MKYKDISYKIQAGDVFAFSGKGSFSDVIKSVTNSNVSHVGIILENAFQYNRIVESATIKDFCGVSVNFVRERIKDYDGEVWWLPLKTEIKRKYSDVKAYDFLLQQLGKHYDLKQAIMAGVDILDIIGIAKNKEDYREFFCSEIVGAALKIGLDLNINPSELTPIDICELDFYSGVYQLKGADLPLKPLIIEEENYGSSVGDLVGDSNSGSATYQGFDEASRKAV